MISLDDNCKYVISDLVNPAKVIDLNGDLGHLSAPIICNNSVSMSALAASECADRRNNID